MIQSTVYWRRLPGLLAIFALLFAGMIGVVSPAHAAGSIGLTLAAYTQNFDTLAAAGTANTFLPTGWDFAESGTSANTTYAAGTGSGTTGDTYSFGAVPVITDRAFGTLQSGALSSTI